MTQEFMTCVLLFMTLSLLAAAAITLTDLAAMDWWPDD